MKAFMQVAKALADEHRVRTLMFLRGKELCVCQIIEMLALAPSTVSKHMSILSQAGLVDSRKQGRWNYYRRSSDPSPVVQGAFQWLDGALEKDPALRQDTAQLRRVRRKPLSELCVCYKN